MPKIMKSGTEYGRFNVAKIMKNNIEYSGTGADSIVRALPTTGTASGAIAQFNTDLTEDIIEFECAFEGSQASGTPAPSSPVLISGINKAEVFDLGKNLIRERLLSKGINSSGVIGSSSSNDIIIAPVKQGQKYAITSSESNKVYAYYTDKPEFGSTSYNGSRSSTGSSQVTITAEITGWIAVRVPNTDTNSQIELGEEITTYEAPTGTDAIINFGSTYYGGTVDAVTGKITLDHGLNTFDGTEANWSATDTHIFRLITTGRNWLPVNAANWQLGYLSNILRTDVRATGATSDKLPDHSFYITSQYLYVRCDEYELSDFKTALGSTNLQIVAPLATPETEYASNTAEIPTIAGVNNCFADCGETAVKFMETVGHHIS